MLRKTLSFVATCFTEAFREMRRNNWESRTTWIGGVILFGVIGDIFIPGWSGTEIPGLSGVEPQEATWQSMLIFWSIVVISAIGVFGHMVIEERKKVKTD